MWGTVVDTLFAHIMSHQESEEATLNGHVHHLNLDAVIDLSHREREYNERITRLRVMNGVVEALLQNAVPFLYVVRAWLSHSDLFALTADELTDIGLSAHDEAFEVLLSQKQASDNKLKDWEE